MSLALQNVSSTRSTAIAELDAGRDRRPAAARVSDDAGDPAAPNSRGALLGAVVDAVQALLPGSPTAAGVQPSDGHASKQALHGFVHALLAELRPAAGDGGHGRGFAWGRTTAATIGDRLDALVARLQASGAATSPQPASSDNSASATTSSQPAAGGDSTSATAPASTASSPSPSPSPPSALLTAFRELATARGAGEGGDSATSDALIAMLKRVASALGADGGAPAPAAGTVLDAIA